MKKIAQLRALRVHPWLANNYEPANAQGKNCKGEIDTVITVFPDVFGVGRQALHGQVFIETSRERHAWLQLSPDRKPEMDPGRL